MEKSDIKAVARLAGVSAATVSRVLSGSAPSTDRTRDAVYRAARELDYNPNVIARSLRIKRTQIVVALLNDIKNPVFHDMLRGLEDTAYKHGYMLLTGNSANNTARELFYLRSLSMGRADGAILITPRTKHAKIKELTSGSPIVLMNDRYHGDDIPNIGIDDKQASFELTRRIVEKGHKRIACFRGTPGLWIAERRLEGFLTSIQQAASGITPLVIQGGSLMEDRYRAMAALHDMKELPTAIICYNDESAIGALTYAAEHGIKVPDTVSIAGFDDIPMSRLYQLGLTTVSQPGYEMAVTAMETLLTLMAKGRPQNYDLVVPHKIIERET